MNSSPRIKPITLLASVCGLIAVVLWITPGMGFQRDGSTEQHDANAAANDGARKNDPATDSRTRVRERPPTLDKTQRQLRDLLAEQRGLIGSGEFDLEKFEQFGARVDRMEVDELLALLKELDASDASESQKVSLSNYIAGAMSRKDPRLALDTFASRITGQSQGTLSNLGRVFDRWARTDLAGATQWLDQQVANGVFPVITDIRSQLDPRGYFEWLLIREQAGRNPAEAAARFAAMPDEARERVLGNDWFSSASAQSVKAVADFLREHSGDQDSAAILAKAASVRIGRGDLAEAAEFLRQIEPVPDERAAIVGEALRVRVTGRDELTMSPQEAREWIVKQAPQDANRLTGTMLGQMIEWHEFPEMSKLALHYREESGSDEVLVAFLKSAPVKSKDEILKLVGELIDPAARAEVTGRFAK